MGVPVVGDAAALVVDPEAVRIALGGDGLEPLEEPSLVVRSGQAVRAPHDHRRRADHAVCDPALLVLEEPGGHAFGAAEQALVHPNPTSRTRSPIATP